MSDELAARVHELMVEYQRRSVSVRALMAEDPHGDLECCDSTAGCIYEEIANELAAALAEEKPGEKSF